MSGECWMLKQVYSMGYPRKIWLKYLIFRLRTISFIMLNIEVFFVQASIGDLCVGLYAWAHILLPLVSGTNVNPQSADLVLQLAEKYVIMHGFFSAFFLSIVLPFLDS